MDPVAKKVSIAIIVILAGTIGVLWYSDFKNDHPQRTATDPLTASSSEMLFDLRAYAAGRSQLQDIIITTLASNTAPIPFEALPSRGQIFTSKDLTLSYSVATSSLYDYGLKVAATLSLLEDPGENEVVVMLAALEKNDTALVQELLSRKETGEKILNSLKKIIVPLPTANIHLKIMNALSLQLATLSDMTRILENPSLAIQSANYFRPYKNDFYQSLESLNQFFREKNIRFPESTDISIN